MLHVANNLFFSRTADGSIRVIKLSRTPEEWPKQGYFFPDDTLVDMLISEAQWARLVTALRIGGVEGDRFYEAHDFNKGLE